MASQLYQPLRQGSDEIRFLILEPALEDSTSVRAKLINSTLGEAPSYEALSYVWGDPSITTAVEIDQGDGPSISIQVTTNLESALRHLRRKDDVRALWVDALCINQADAEEKASQLRYIGTIYNQAAQVCIWLGPEENASYQAIELVNLYGSADEDTRLGMIQDAIWLPHWKALTFLVCRDWFSRRWTVQEIALARYSSVFCGKKFSTWTGLMKATLALEHDRNEFNIQQNALNQFRR